MVEKKKQKKRSEQTAIEIQEHEKNVELWNEYKQEKRKLLEIKLRQFLEQEDKFKYEIVKDAGLFLERLGIVNLNQISTEITRAFKGYISRLHVQQSCGKVNENWVRGYTYTGGNSKSKISEREKSKNMLSESLTQQELDYIKAHEDEKRRYHLLSDLIESLTNLSIADQGRIVGQTPKGQDIRKKFAEASNDYWLKVSKQMVPSDIDVTLWDFRTLEYLMSKFGDVLYEEKEIRKRKAHLESA